MTYRRILMALVVGWFGLVLYRVTGSDAGADVALANTLPWAVVIVLMLPVERLTTTGLKDLLKIWKDKPDDQ